jgi:hypothetical protein
MRFEQLDVWKRASRLSCDIYKLTESVSNWGFKDQLHVQAYLFPQI